MIFLEKTLNVIHDTILYIENLARMKISVGYTI